VSTLAALFLMLLKRIAAVFIWLLVTLTSVWGSTLGSILLANDLWKIKRFFAIFNG
jgi:hypothetical protein